MPIRHYYFGVENLALSPAQRSALFNAIKTLGPGTALQPAHLNHWRIRLDNDAGIFEDSFTDEETGIPQVKWWLAAIFNINPNSITHAVVTISFAGGTTPVITFAHGGTDYIRMAMFGGPTATWMESGDECRGYLAQFRDQWEPPEEEPSLPQRVAARIRTAAQSLRQKLRKFVGG